MRLRTTRVFFALIVSGLLASIVVCASEDEGIFIVDYQSHSPERFPSSEVWQQIMAHHQGEIRDGSMDPEFLNGCYLLGWNRCLYHFSRENWPWRYQEIEELYPTFLGGKMVDTKRIAKNKGWKDASANIEIRLLDSSKDDIKEKLIRPNGLLIASLSGMLVCGLCLAVMLWGCGVLGNHPTTRDDASDSKRP